MLKALPTLVVFLLFFAQSPVTAQALRNDGFQRRNGQMYVLRNGQARPMVRDARLPTGAVVTKDGFILGADGKRTELREGQGCDLKGNPVAVVSLSSGGLALSAPAKKTVARTSARKPAVEVRAVLEDLLGRGSRAEHRDEREEYDEKYEEKAREQRKKEEEWQREERKRQEEYERERGKKWKEKRKEGKKWDD